MPFVYKNYVRLKTILSKEQTEIVNTAVWLMLPALLTKISGQIYNLITASYYGTEDIRMQFFLYANNIPELLTTVLMVGAVGTVTIPLLLACKDKDGEQTFYKVYSSIINFTVIVFLLFTAILIIFGDQLFPFFLNNIIKPTILITDSDLDTIVDMMRVLLIPQFVLGISIFISSGLNIYDRYIIPQLSPLFYNLGRILVVIALIPAMDKSPWALVIAVVIGSMLHLIIQIPLFLSLRFKYYFTIDFGSKYIKEIFRVGTPRIFALASDQVAFAFNKFLAGAFLGGAQALNLATSLYLLVPSVFGYTFSYASYPTLSKLYIKQDYVKIKYIVLKTINEIFFLAIPFVLTIMVLRVPIVRLTYGIVPNTNLSLEGSYQIAWVLLFFTPGLVFITARWFVLSLYYAAKDTITPLMVTAFSLFSVVGLSILLTNFFSYNQEYSINELFKRFVFVFDNFSPNLNLSNTIYVLLALACFFWIGYLIYQVITYKLYRGFIGLILGTVLLLLTINSMDILTFDLNINQFVVRSDGKAAVAGISFAMSIVYSIEFIILLYIFNRNKVNIGLKKVISSTSKKFVAGGSMLVFMYLLYKTWTAISYSIPDVAENDYVGSTTFNLILLTLVTVVPSFLLYYLICYLLKVEELVILRKFLNPIFKLGGLNIKQVEESISETIGK